MKAEPQRGRRHEEPRNRKGRDELLQAAPNHQQHRPKEQRRLRKEKEHLQVGEGEQAEQQPERERVAVPIAAVGNVVRGGNRVRIGGVSLPIGLILLRGQIRAQAAERHAQERHGDAEQYSGNADRRGVNFSEAGDERFRTGLAGTGVFDEVKDFGNGGLAEFLCGADFQNTV